MPDTTFIPNEPASAQTILRELTKSGVHVKATGPLLEIIRALRACVGDGLSEQELSRIVQAAEVPQEAGFGFRSVQDGFVVLSIPPQDPANWYRENGWITCEKEQAAIGIATKYGLFLFESSDTGSNPLDLESSSPCIRHQIELNDGCDTLVIAHPDRLKVRLFSSTTSMPGFLQDLSALYQPNVTL